MINSSAELNRAIRNKNNEYSIEDIFSSKYLTSYVLGIVTTMCQKYNRTPQLELEYLPESNETAYTDGNEIYCNTASPLIRELKNPYRMFLSLFGHIAHEASHILYTCFDYLNPLRTNWCEGTTVYYPFIPDISGAEEFRDYLLNHPNYRTIYSQEMCNLVNIMEDVYIENMARNDFSGLVTVGLKVANDEKYRLSTDDSKIMQMVIDGKITGICAANIIIQMRKLGYSIKTSPGISDEQKEVKKVVEKYIEIIETELEDLKWESNGRKRAILFNKIFVKFQGLLPRPKDNEDYKPCPNNEGSQDENQDNKDNSSNQNDRDLTDEEKDKYMSNSEKVKKENGVSKEAKGKTSGCQTKADKEKVDDEKEKAERIANSDEASANLVNQAKKDISEIETLSEVEKKHLEELKNESKEIESQSKKVKNSDFREYKLYRDDFITSAEYMSQYNILHKEVASQAKSLSRKLANILKEQSIKDESDSGYMFGNKLNSHDIYRKDRKMFSRKISPSDKITVCFSILVDQSGSMFGRKIDRAKSVAILLEDALRQLGVPLLIVGHTEDYGKVILKPYVDFDTSDNRDKYRLCGIEAYYGNIDGAAINYMTKKLQKRPEDIKVLIVISDGLPAGTSFFANYPIEDTKEAIKVARKQNIKVFGACVDCFEDISNIYGQQFSFDCTSGKMLEKNLCMLIKKYVLMSK